VVSNTIRDVAAGRQKLLLLVLLLWVVCRSICAISPGLGNSNNMFFICLVHTHNKNKHLFDFKTIFFRLKGRILKKERE